MVDGTTADARLERLLHVLPAAARKDGASLERLARELDTTPRRLLDDLEEVTARIYYHPGGWPDDLRILLEGDRVRVVHAQGLDRPVRLSPRELLCLALALRGGTAVARVRDDEARQALLRRAEAHLAQESEEALARPPVEAPHRAPDPEEIRGTVLAAARDRTPCGILYVKDGAHDAEGRVIHPYVVAYADGAWYTVAHCTVSEGVRIFRVDRILEAAPARGTFRVPPSFDPDAYLDARPRR